MSTPSGLIEPLKILLIIAFVFKTLDIFYLIGQQTDATVFFMDWERPKIGSNFAEFSRWKKFFFSFPGSQDTVSVWRTYFVANEYNEIQTFRRINVPFQLFFILFFLQVENEHWFPIERNISSLFFSGFEFRTNERSPKSNRTFLTFDQRNGHLRPDFPDGSRLRDFSRHRSAKKKNFRRSLNFRFSRFQVSFNI